MHWTQDDEAQQRSESDNGLLLSVENLILAPNLKRKVVDCTFPSLVLFIVQLFAREQGRFEKIGEVLEELGNGHFQGGGWRKTVGR
jgi:hypothetical protein